jgi:hypothetical protein
MNERSRDGVTTVVDGVRMPLDQAEELVAEKRRARQRELDEERREKDRRWETDRLWAGLREGF